MPPRGTDGQPTLEDPATGALRAGPVVSARLMLLDGPRCHSTRR